MQFNPNDVDSSRAKKALSKELTPLEIDRNEKTACFVGSEGDLYNTDMTQCSCMDFSMNLGGMKPCKHMIRLAMEIGQYPSAGMASDPNYPHALATYANIKHVLKTDDLCNAVVAARFISDLLNGCLPADTAEDMEDYSLSDMITYGIAIKKGKKYKATKEWVKPLNSLKDAFARRLGEIAISCLSDEVMIQALAKNDRALSFGPV